MRRTNYNDVELETTFEQFVLDLLGNRVKADVRSGTNFLDICGGHDGEQEQRLRKSKTVATGVTLNLSVL